MIKEIIQQLKTGPIKEVREFGDSQLPPAPYLVIRSKRDIIGRGEAIEVFAHFNTGYQKQLREYVQVTIPNLLDEFKITTANGYKELNILSQEITDIVLNDDNTISMSRTFLSPNINGF